MYLSHKTVGPWEGTITAFIACVYDVIISRNFQIVNGIITKIVS
jgi:hypothetical protein